MHVVVGGIKQWLWRAVDEHGAVLDILLQEHRGTEAAKSFFIRLLGKYHIPEAIHTDKLRWSTPKVASSAWCNNLVEQSHRPTRQQERCQIGFRGRQRAQEFLTLHALKSPLPDQNDSPSHSKTDESDLPQRESGTKHDNKQPETQAAQRVVLPSLSLICQNSLETEARKAGDAAGKGQKGHR